MGTADQDDDTKAPTDPATTGAPGDEGRVADEGGDSDPAAAAGSTSAPDSGPTGEEQAAENREDESPS